MISYVVF